jgi:phytoene dehydrogenase-like protein
VHQFDLAVAETGLGGLAAAALLSVRGKKVTVSTPYASLAGALGATAADGFLFSSGPSLLHGFEAGGAFQQLFHDSGIHDAEPAHAAVYQVALPDRRITISRNQEETNEDLRREFPREIDTIVRFYRDLGKAAGRISQSRIAAFFLKHRSAGTFVRKFNFSRELSTFFDIQALHFFQRPVADLSLAALITLCTRWPDAVSPGYRKLAERLIEVIRRKGGEVRLNEPPTEIVFQHNRAKGLKTAQGFVEAAMVLLCATEKSMPSLFLGIRDEVVPVGMERDIFYLPDYARPRDFLTYSLSAKGDLTAAPKGMRALNVTFHELPGQAHDADALIGKVSGLVPFLKDFLVLTLDSRSSGTSAVPDSLSFKPLSSGQGDPLLFKASQKNVYLLHEAQHAPLQVIPAARRLVEKIS